MNNSKLYDNHGREINYLRLAVTDRCNLRCFYCMPEEGINYVPRDELLTFEEMLRLIRLLATMGIHKIRITGGEPFVRKGIMEFMEEVVQIEGIQSLHLTTNGTQTKKELQRLIDLGIASVNLSLDSLDKDRFFEITRRDQYDRVMNTLHALMETGIKTKINAVVMDGKNDQDILPMVAFTENNPVAIRFIEEMPFNGSGMHDQLIKWNFKEILNHIKSTHPNIEKIKDGPFSTSLNYKVPGWKGSFGVIPAFSRTFCGTCNRIRITPQGTLKTCLYDDGVFNVRDLIRHGAKDQELKSAFLDALSHRAKDGFESEKNRTNQFVSESMSTIGG